MDFSAAARRGIVRVLAGAILAVLLAGLGGLALVAEPRVLDGVEPVAAVRTAADRLDDQSFSARVEVASPFGREPLLQECDFDASGQRTRCLLSGVGEGGELITAPDGIYLRRLRPAAGQKPWLRLNEITGASALSGANLDFTGMLAPALSNAGPTLDLGVEKIDGERTRHLRTELSFEGFELPGGAQPVPVADLWLDDEGRLRRSVVTASALGFELRIQIDLSDYGGVDGIELPHADDVDQVGPEGIVELLGG